MEKNSLGRSLQQIGLSVGTDKVTSHNYAPCYEEHFGPLRSREIVLVEIGVYQGASIRMWEEYFPKAKIYGVDIAPSCLAYATPRSRIVIGSQEDPAFLKKLGETTGPIDILIDDGGHTMNQQRTSFQHLFPRIRPGGLYIIEDLETSYRPAFGGGHVGLQGTTIRMLKNMIDAINNKYHEGSLVVAPAKIESLRFYDNICFIRRG